MKKRVSNPALKPLSGRFQKLNHPGVYRNSKRVYAKVYNDLSNSRNIRFNTIRQALARAVFFNELRKQGVFHPDSRFIVSKDRRGKPTVVALMPELTPARWPAERLNKRFVAMVRDVFGKHLLSKEIPGEHGDLLYQFNYGKSRSGRKRVYYRDLHVIESTPSKAVLQWYRLRKASQKG